MSAFSTYFFGKHFCFVLNAMSSLYIDFLSFARSFIILHRSLVLCDFALTIIDYGQKNRLSKRF